MSPSRNTSEQLSLQYLGLHSLTPTLVIADPRCLPVRRIDYYRCQADTAAESRINAQWHDHAGRPTDQWDARQFAHFQAGTSATPNQHTAFSLTGNVVIEHNVDSGGTTNLYDAAGRLAESWNANGAGKQYRYDPCARPVAILQSEADGGVRTTQRLSYGAADATSAARNQCGRVCRHDDDSGTLLFECYTLRGETSAQRQRFLTDTAAPDWPVETPARDALLEPGDGYLSLNQFDAVGAPLTMTDAKGNRQTPSYDMTGQEYARTLHTAAGARHELASAIEFDAAARMIRQRLGNGVTCHTQYCERSGRLVQLRAVRTQGEVVQDLRYDYDLVGNVLSVTDATQATQHFANQRIEPTQRYAYDTLYQLTSASGREAANAEGHGPGLPGLQPLSDDSRLRNYTQRYSYDSAGNLVQLRHVNGQSNWTRTLSVARNSNRALPERNGQLPDEAAIAAGFDRAGNLRELQPGQRLLWNGDNQLAQVTPVTRDDGDDDHERYVYGHDGLRTRKVASAQGRMGARISEVRYLPGLEIRTDSARGEELHVIKTQAGRSSMRLLHWQSEPPESLPNDQLRYGLDNALGSCTIELDGTAQLLSREEYYPFGGTACWAARNAVEASYKTVRYAGKERDASGLYYYGLRYYAPWLQRWINPDPGGLIDGLNLYRMVSNNPITRRDEQGLKGKDLNDRINTRIHRFEGVLGDKERAAQNINDAIENERNKWLKRARAVGRATVVGLGAAAGYAGGGVAGAAFGSWGGPPGMVAGMVVGTLAAGEVFSQSVGKLADEVGLGAPLNIMSHSFDWDYDSHEQQDSLTIGRRIKERIRALKPKTEVEWADTFKDVTERALPFGEAVSQQYVVASVVPSAFTLGVEYLKGPKSDEKISSLIDQGDVLVNYINWDFAEIKTLLAQDGAQYPSTETQFKALPYAKDLDSLERRKNNLITQIRTTQANLRQHLENRKAA